MRNEKAKDLLAPLQTISFPNIPSYDFHLHTNWTDGTDSIADMYNAACAKKLDAVLFSEHVRQTSADWFDRFVSEVKEMNSQRCCALIGLETRVFDFEGNLDCTQSMIESCDLVIASVHRFPSKIDGNPLDFNTVDISEALDIEYRLTMGLLENDDVDILGHPFGMCIKRFRILPPRKQMLEVIKKAAKKNIAVEINATYHSRLWEMIGWCRENGALISLGSDAHSINEVGLILRNLKRGDYYETNTSISNRSGERRGAGNN